jgi:hypothetical protein
MLKIDPHGMLYRAIAGVVGVAIIGMGLAPILRSGDWSYRTWYGGLAFAPVVVLLGAFIIFSALFKPKWLGATRVGSKRDYWR